MDCGRFVQTWLRGDGPDRVILIRGGSTLSLQTEEVYNKEWVEIFCLYMAPNPRLPQDD